MGQKVDMKLSEMKQILTADAIRLTKSLGQNFLHDANQLERIIRAAEVEPGDRILEIGPGLGPLTQGLLDRQATVLAIEIDHRLYAILQRRFGASLQLIQFDALDYIRERKDADWSGWKLVSNLPYSVASPILVELAQMRGRPERMVATLQIEVAQKILADAGTEDYGLLSLLLQLRYRPAGSFKIPASCFFPEPDVASACITLLRRSEPLLPFELEQTFDLLIKRAFSQRRKMMFKLLKEAWPESSLSAAFQAAGLKQDIRAEKVTLEQFVTLTRTLDSLNLKTH
jgi:16S rRNA (adenine1518-N6/adenine1519-N6)-dimethyltransferase